MTKKSKKEEPLEDFLEGELKDGYQVVVAWRPKYRLVNLLTLRVNGQRLTVDAMDDESPWFTKAPPSADGSFQVRWAISPRISLTGAVIAIVNSATREYVIVDKKEAVERDELWEGSKDVKAP